MRCLSFPATSTSTADPMAAKKPTAKQRKARATMHEFKAGTLHSGKGGPVVKSRRQAVAIALSQAAKKKGKG